MRKTALLMLTGAPGSVGSGEVVSGGRTISHWTVDKRGWWHAAVEPGDNGTLGGVVSNRVVTFDPRQGVNGKVVRFDGDGVRLVAAP